MLGLENVKGLEFLNGSSFSGLFSGISAFSKFMLIAILGGGILLAYLYFQNQKKAYDKKLHIFEEINGQMIPLRDDLAIEMTIPGTTVKVFYVKGSNMYLPRPTRAMGKDRFWYAIRRNREWVNFTMKNLNKEMVEAGLDFDHTDMLYANAQLKKLIERNYKKTKWWQEYRSEISMAILILMLTFSFWFLLGEIKEIVGGLGPLVEAMKEVAEINRQVLGAVDNVATGSGVIIGS